jgi:transcriptional regulator with XRE-family HTH domain
LKISYIKKLRIDYLITQKRMAEILNLKQSDIFKIELKERKLDILELFEWAKKYNRDKSFLSEEIENILMDKKL